MKNIVNFIIEKLIINKHSKIKNHLKDIKIKDIFDSFDKTIDSWSDFHRINEKVFDSNVLSFIHSYIKRFPVYMWIDREDEVIDYIKQLRKDRNINDSNLIPKSIAGDNSVVVVLMDKDIEYIEIYINSKITNKHYIILQ